MLAVQGAGKSLLSSAAASMLKNTQSARHPKNPNAVSPKQTRKKHELLDLEK